MQRSVLFIITGILFLSACSRQQGIHPERKDIIESVYASGEVVPADQYIINSMVDGYLSRKLVNEGDIVEKGARLFLISNEQTEAQLRNSLDNLSVASGNYSENSAVLGPLYAQLETAKAKLKTDSLNYHRYLHLKGTGAVSQVEFEQMYLVWQNSKAQVESIEDNIRSTRGELFKQLSGAKSNVTASLEAHNNYELTSEIDGKVYSISKVPGELVKRGDAIAMMGKADSMIIRLNIQDEDISQIELQQEVLVELNTEPGHIYKARVSKILPAFDPQNQSFKIEAVFTDAPKKIFAGTQVVANIVIATRKNAIVIPKSYVNGNDEVMLKKKHEIRKVKRGIEDTEMVEILSGITENDILLKQK
ncbi:MAG TPA: HlyD family efflux transporter periplasmic adaptor subunit [Bacteroidales bacterium]|nr:HlyD family efflux transporter periplasmic adaptor subunit [Bacteroidales bacterium]